MVTHQIAHNNERSEQLSAIQKIRFDLPGNPEKASAALLFEYYDVILKVDRKPKENKA
jgi:hypothetical protein